MSESFEIGAWLETLGYESAKAQEHVRAILVAAGLTREARHRMATEKLARAMAVIGERVVPSCKDRECRAIAAGRVGAGQLVVESTAAACSVCGGSNNRRAVLAMAEAARSVGVSRILVLGGTTAQHAELRDLVASQGIGFRTVDGVEHAPNKRSALRDLEWAELMVVWASTPLPHKVSVSYTDECPADLPVVIVARRGLEALCSEITASLRARGHGRRARAGVRGSG